MNAQRRTTDVAVHAADLEAANRQVVQGMRGLVPGSIALAALVNATAVLTTRGAGVEMTTLGGAVAVAATAAALSAPIAVLLAYFGRRKSVQHLAATIASERHMTQEAARRELETRIANAFEMAEDEAETLQAAARGIEATLPERFVEVLVADNSHAHLDRVAVVGAGTDHEGCCVESPDRCVAARRGQAMVFEDSDQIDACPKLAGRAQGPVSAVCVPVSIMGRSVGVVHHAAPRAAVAPDPPVEALEVIASQLGARLGMLRAMAESQLQAGTDGLTGLSNRRAFENRVRVLRQAQTSFSLVLADLDEFKRINDTFGHGTGDRALRVFSSVLASSLRPMDLCCRYGGEEFVLVLPDCDTTATTEVCVRIRDQLAATLRSGEVPAFTASFGVAGFDPSLTTDQLLARADAALYQAKVLGRDRIEVHRAGPGPAAIPDEVAAEAT